MKYDLEDVIRKICPNCKVEFRTFNDTQKYCTKECGIAFRVQDYDISKEAIFRRDEYRCIYCGQSSIEDGVKLVLEHVYPIVEGGKEDLFNLATSCDRCNTKKSDKILSEEIILRIWDRNQRLNEKFNSEEYEKLVETFKKNLKQRQSKII